MASLVFVVLISAMISASDGAWCVCRSDVSDTALQKTLDYACGAGADCTPIKQGGACYNPNTVRAHCSYAANSFYQRKGQSSQACDFTGTATLSSNDPGGNGCTYPSSSSAAGSSSSSTNNQPTTNSPGSSTTTLTPPTATPPTTNGSGGILGGGGLGSTGNGTTISTDSSRVAFLSTPNPFIFILSLILIFSTNGY